MTILKTTKSRSIVTAPLDDVDTNNPNQALLDTDSPESSGGYDPGLILGRSEFDSHPENQFCKRVWCGVRSTTRHYGA